VVAGALVTPYAAHALNVIYYRLTDPDHPILPDQPQQAWHSVWHEQDAAES
jgi:hypothetical protein